MEKWHKDIQNFLKYKRDSVLFSEICDMTKEDINDRTIQAIEYLLSSDSMLGKAKLARELDVKPSKFSEILNKRMNAGTELMAILCEKYNISPNWLLTGKGPMLYQPPEEELADRFSEIVQILGAEPTAKAFGVTEIELIDFTNGLEISENTFFDYRKFFNQYPEFNYKWLLMGIGEMLPSPKEESIVRLRAMGLSEEGIPTTHPHKSFPIAIDECNLPLLPFSALCGYGTPVFDDLPVEGYYSVPEFRNADFLIRLVGDSMIPRFFSGDILACKIIKERLFFQWNKIYALHSNSQGVMVKRVIESEKVDYIRLVSDNSNYAPFDVPLSDIAALALVIGVIRVE